MVNLLFIQRRVGGWLVDASPTVPPLVAMTPGMAIGSRCLTAAAQTYSGQGIPFHPKLAHQQRWSEN